MLCEKDFNVSNNLRFIIIKKSLDVQYVFIETVSSKQEKKDSDKSNLLVKHVSNCNYKIGILE